MRLYNTLHVFLVLMFCACLGSQAIYDSLGPAYKSEMVVFQLKPKEWLTDVVPKPRKPKKAQKTKDETQDEQEAAPSGDTRAQADDTKQETRKTPRKRSMQDVDEIPRTNRKSLEEFFSQRRLR